MSGRSRGSTLLRSLASSWLGLAVGILVSFFLSPFVVNKLGATWFGVWAVASQFVGYLYLMDFGVRESVVRYTSKYAARGNRRALNHVLSTALVVYSGITALALAVVVIAVWGMPHWFNLEPELWRDARLAMAFTGLTIAMTFLLNVFTGVIIGLKQWELSNGVGIVLNLLRAGLIVLFLQRGYGIVALAAIQFGVSLAGGLINVLVALWLLDRASLRFHFAWLRLGRYVALGRRILGYGFYVIINNVGEKIISATDVIVVGLFMPIHTVSYYAIAGSLTGYLNNLLSASAAIFSPMTSELHSLRQREQVAAALYLGIKICTLVTLPVVATFVILGEEFIGLWMGPEFAPRAAPVLAILSIAALLSAPKFVVSSVLYGMSRHRVIAFLRMAEAIANLGISLLLVKRLGLVGVALGTAIPSAVVALIALPLLAGREVGVRLPEFFENAYLRPILAISPFAAAALWIRGAFPANSLVEFFAQVAALLVIYIPCAFLLVLNGDERRIILGRIGLAHLLR